MLNKQLIGADCAAENAMIKQLTGTDQSVPKTLEGGSLLPGGLSFWLVVRGLDPDPCPEGPQNQFRG